MHRRFDANNVGQRKFVAFSKKDCVLDLTIINFEIDWNHSVKVGKLASLSQTVCLLHQLLFCVTSQCKTMQPSVAHKPVVGEVTTENQNIHISQKQDWHFWNQRQKYFKG